jgi:hypothetical protein
LNSKISTFPSYQKTFPIEKYPAARKMSGREDREIAIRKPPTAA